MTGRRKTAGDERPADERPADEGPTDEPPGSSVDEGPTDEGPADEGGGPRLLSGTETNPKAEIKTKTHRAETGSKL